MNAPLLFVGGLAITLVTSVSVVIYLKSSLQKILVELCGSPERAAFWTSFSNVALAVVPVIFAMQYHPETRGTTSVVFELADQLKWGLIGVVLSITLLAWVLSRFIPRVPVPDASNQTGRIAHSGPREEI
jgi:hypothetical protein